MYKILKRCVFKSDLKLLSAIQIIETISRKVEKKKFILKIGSSIYGQLALHG